jgi:lysozyme
MCHDETEVPIQYQPNARLLAEHVLERIRQHFGGPLVPLSWYRTPEYNASIGGAKHSQHILALAADIRPVEMPALGRLVSTVETMIANGQLPRLGGFGVYRGWIHVDARVKPADGHIARWFGKGVGSEQ